MCPNVSHQAQLRPSLLRTTHGQCLIGNGFSTPPTQGRSMEHVNWKVRRGQTGVRSIPNTQRYDFVGFRATVGLRRVRLQYIPNSGLESNRPPISSLCSRTCQVTNFLGTELCSRRSGTASPALPHLSSCFKVVFVPASHERGTSLESKCWRKTSKRGGCHDPRRPIISVSINPVRSTAASLVLGQPWRRYRHRPTSSARTLHLFWLSPSRGPGRKERRKKRATPLFHTSSSYFSRCDRAL